MTVINTDKPHKEMAANVCYLSCPEEAKPVLEVFRVGARADALKEELVQLRGED